MLIVLVFGLLASVAIFGIARRGESRARRVEFDSLARDRVLAIRATVDTQLADIHSLEALLTSIEDLGREDFGEFSRDLLSYGQGLQALEWIPRVPLARRAEFRARARAEGFPNFEFREQGPDSMITAGIRPEYYPVYYLEPLEGNEPALGFDLGSDATRHEAIERCLASGQPVATHRVDLVQEAGGQHGILVLVPVYDGEGEVKGLVLGALRVGDLLVQALSRLQARPIEVALYDVTEPNAPVYLAAVGDEGLLAEADSPHIAGTDTREIVRVADRRWMVAARASESSQWSGGVPGPVGLMLIGIATTVALAAFLVHRVRSERRVREFERELAHLARVATTGELVASIAHELNQPLCAIVLNAQAARRVAESDRDVLESTLGRIIEDGERAGETIRNLREFLRDGEAVQRPVYLASIVRETVRIFSATDTVRHPIELRMESSLPLVAANEVQIQQVLLNLIINSAEAVDAAGAVDRKIRVSLERGGSNRVVSSGEDAGPGIDGSTEEQLFAPFFTTKERGMGMGLSICKSIIESHGGRIWTEASSVGARFRFSLPVAED